MMRRLSRSAPVSTLLVTLSKYQHRVKDATTAAEEWNRFRKTQAYSALREGLRVDAGQRERCFFCSDSLGVDVEHFWPKKKYPERTFDYYNLLLACGACNRLKQDRFDLATDGTPLLVDPTLDDPWDSLFFDEVSGLLRPKLALGSDAAPVASRRGEYTISVLGDVLNRTSLSTARVSSWENLVERLAKMCDEGGLPAADAAPTDVFPSTEDFGLTDWLLHREGAEAAGVRTVRNKCPQLWRAVRDL